MTQEAKILDGKKIAAERLEALHQKVLGLKQVGAQLKLATIRVGDSKDAELYSRAISNLMQKLDITCTPIEFPGQTADKILIAKIRELNNDPSVTGILVFSPLPATTNSAAILAQIDMTKDVESRQSLVKLPDGERIASPTAESCAILVDYAAKDKGEMLAGKEACVIGRSDIVGKPVATLLLDRRITVTVCHTKTSNLPTHVLAADVVIATAGSPKLVKAQWIKPGAIVIDVGENMVQGKLTGDVDFDAVKTKAGYISPVPGGVGPVTNIALAENLFKLHEWKKYRESSHK